MSTHFATQTSPKKAVFFDRDGTLIVEKHYLKDPLLVEFEPTVIDALRLLQHHQYLLFIVTNQSGIARGKLDTYDFLSTQSRLIYLLKTEGITLTDFWYCPHLETGAIPRFSTVCTCRKPKPGMLLEAIKTYHLDPEQCWMIGDKPSDIQAGLNANLPKMQSLQVQTGYGSAPQPDTLAFPTLLQAATHIISFDNYPQK